MVTKKQLLFIASLVWFIAGGVLIYRGATGILHELEPSILNIIFSIILGFIFYLLVFNSVSKKHIARIKNMTDVKVPAYSFFSFKSFIMMALMMTMGITLKITGIIPISFMVYFFPVMGIPLFISAIRFFISAIEFN